MLQIIQKKGLKVEDNHQPVKARLVDLLSFFALLLAFSYPLNTQAQDTLSKPASTIAHELGVDRDASNIRNTLTPLLIARFGGGASGLAQRVSGVYVRSGETSIRGLNSRYTSILIDDLNAGVTEQKVKSFSLDFIPGGILQQMTIHKSGLASNPGEFAGGVINAQTVSTVPKNYDVVSFGMGFRVNTTFKDFYVDPDYGISFGNYLGFAGQKKRGFFDDVPNFQTFQALSRNQSAEYGKVLNNSWGAEKTTALPDVSVSYRMGRLIKLRKADRALSTTNMISYGRGSVSSYGNRFSYGDYKAEADGVVNSAKVFKAATDAAYAIGTQLSALSNWELKAGARNTIKWTNLFTQNGKELDVLRYQVNYQRTRESILSSVGMEAMSNYLTRLRGTHVLNGGGTLSWAAGYNYIHRIEPDLKRFGGNRNYKDSGANYLMVVPDGSKADAGARFGSDMVDNNLNGRVDYTNTNLKHLTLRGGVYADYSKRKFESRLLTFALDGNTRSELLFVPFNVENLKTVFGPQNFGPDGYFTVDGTSGSDNYNSSYTLMGGYFDITKKFNRFQFNAGVRLENFDQKLDADTFRVNNNTTDFLPSLNLSYALAKNMYVKGSYSRSVNRPAFREIAPFAFYDYDFSADIQGNASLKNASINNFDIKWELYFGKGDILSIAGFYKQFKDPIEMYYIIRSELPLFTYLNSNQAKVGGIEFEIKKTLSYNPESAWSKMAVYLNAAYIGSIIDLGEASVEVNSSRPLQGQSPYVINFSYVYSDVTNGWGAELIYNVAGKSLYSTGDGQETYPWYLMPRNMLDINISKRIGKKFGVSLGVSNLLDAAIEIREDANIDGDVKSVGGADNVIQKFYQGQRITAGLSWRIN
jgi:outer membrane receptor protein involved in Fe transport